jgi:hypothetical protein
MILFEIVLNAMEWFGMVWNELNWLKRFEIGFLVVLQCLKQF